MDKIEQRQCSNLLLENVINLHLSLFPELRYIQNLWALKIIDTKYIQNEEAYILDRYYEEPYDTVIRILPKIIEMINEKFPKDTSITNKLRRINIITSLEKLELAEKTSDYKLVMKKNKILYD